MERHLAAIERAREVGQFFRRDLDPRRVVAVAEDTRTPSPTGTPIVRVQFMDGDVVVWDFLVLPTQ